MTAENLTKLLYRGGMWVVHKLDQKAHTKIQTEKPDSLTKLKSARKTSEDEQFQQQKVRRLLMERQESYLKKLVRNV